MVWILPLLLSAAFFAASILAAASAFRPPVIREAPAGGEKVSFPSGKNRLAGYLWNKTGTRGLIVLAHGMGTSVSYHLPEINRFAAEDYKVFAFEYSGYGESTGHFYGFPQAVADLKSAVEFADDGALPLILWGHSMGGYAVCAAPQCLRRPVSAIVAYAPFYSSGEAIEEMTRGMVKYGWLLRLLILPGQRILFGAGHRRNGISGLRAANAPALILQGSRDDEVRCTGCSMYAHRRELADTAAVIRLVEREDSSGHMTIVRKKGTKCLNEETMQYVRAFLDELTN